MKERIKSHETRCLLELLSVIVSGTEFPRWNLQPKWSELYKIANFHDVANVLYYYTVTAKTRWDNKQWINAIEDNYRNAVHKEQCYSGAIPKLLKLFESQKVDCLLCKDYYLKDFYPQPDMKNLKEVDLVFDPSREATVKKIMSVLDFELKETEDSGAKRYYKYPGVSLIVRTDMGFRGKKIRKEFSGSIKGYRRKEGFNFIHELTDEGFYVYFISNLAEKFAKGQMKIRDVLDLWVYYSDKSKKLNFATINDRLREISIEKFHTLLVKLAASWFAAMRFEDDKIPLKSMEDYIFSNGLEGRVICEKILPLVTEFHKDNLKQMKLDEKKKVSDWRFPPLEYMSTIFPRLEEQPWLLGYYWMVRLMRMNSKRANIAHKKRVQTARKYIYGNVEKQSLWINTNLIKIRKNMNRSAYERHKKKFEAKRQENIKKRESRADEFAVSAAKFFNQNNGNAKNYTDKSANDK